MADSGLFERFDRVGYFRWDSLRKIQVNRIVRSLYVWLVIVPVAVKLLHKVESPLVFQAQGRAISLDLTLPFSWKVFFFSALFFVLGNILFGLFAPRLIKDFSDFGDFLASGKTFERLRSYMDNPLRPLSEKDGFDWAFIARNPEAIKKQEAQTLFWRQYDLYSVLGRQWRLLTGLSYGIGFVLFCFVAIDNISWVFREL